jgi:transposase
LSVGTAHNVCPRPAERIRYGESASSYTGDSSYAPPTPELLRRELWTLARHGQPPESIADTLQLSVRTVRRLLARFRSHGQAVPPTYQRCGRPCTPAFQHLRAEVLAWRRLHSGWGAGRLHVQLRQHHPGESLPDVSTLRRWLKRAGLAATPPRAPVALWPWADQPHQIWQMDATEQLPLRSGQRVSWLRLIDEASGAALFSQIFAQGCWAAVGAAAVQQTLRAAFARWGRPHGLRVDNGTPWVSQEGLPTDLELWLAGLDVRLHRNRPHRPQANSKVERSQRTARAWAEPGSCDTPEHLQTRLDEEDRVQREEFAFAEGHSRRDAYPALYHSGRGYALLGWESVCWDLEAALACLARQALGRKVDRSGRVSLYDHRYRVGVEYAGERVHVRLEVATRAWVFVCGDREVGRAAARQLSEASICQLCLSRRPGRSAERTRRKRGQGQEAAVEGAGDPNSPPTEADSAEE